MRVAGARRVVVTGIGVVSSVGIGAAAFFDALVGGVSGIEEISSFDASAYSVRIAGEVKSFDAGQCLERKAARRMDRYAQMAVVAALQAREDAALDLGALDPYQVGVLVGSGVGGLWTFYEQTKILLQRGPARVSPFFVPMMIPNMGAAHVSIALGLKGPVSATCTACAASTNALGDAFEIVRRGDALIMFAGGAEAPINPPGISGFAAARALSTRNDDPLGASRPFDVDRDGFVVGEGAAVLVLEEREHALARGAHIIAEVLGYGMTADAFHLTEPDESGVAAATAMTRALQQGGVDPMELDYVNAHGTSTPLGDVMETRAIKHALGPAAAKVAISSTKSMIGHCLGAAGALEAAATVLTIHNGIIHPTLNLESPDPECDLDYVPLVARRAPVQYAVSNSFGFGGHNASVVFGAG
ncbi:MAG: beta-ketoacyl-ACP synthase II [Actinobacteria bacterium]|nr:beta-ketoacyl-ACP synthase II [Actinomycetota bacterium]